MQYEKNNVLVYVDGWHVHTRGSRDTYFLERSDYGNNYNLKKESGLHWVGGKK